MLPEIVVAGGLAGVVYHHVGYPMLLRSLARRARSARPRDTVAPTSLPTVTVIVPAYDEAAVIAAKVRMLAALDYPAGQLRCLVVTDGCRDATAAIAERTIAETGCTHIALVEHAHNRGKIAVLNETIAACDSAIVVLTDASAGLAPDCIRRAVRHFDDPGVGVVCPTYAIPATSSEGEHAYWRYQVSIKADEAALGAPIGAHGAFYLFRRALWTPLPADTINDDVILPMRIVARGFRAIYDTDVAALEMEPSTPAQDFRRRIRIGAGNLQQLLRLMALADPRRPGLAFVFLSGKALRCLVPFIVIAGALAGLNLAVNGSVLFMNLLILGALMVLAAVAVASRPVHALPRPLAVARYLVEGHVASFWGAIRYLLGLEGKPWSKADVADGASGAEPIEADYIPRSVAVGKRVVDIVCALAALVVLAILFVPLAIAIKLDSRGPVFYRQLRVGRCTPTTTHIFHLIKLRTMRTDSEAVTGAVWATKDDPRITRVGRFLRKTRLDELPQAINVLKGEMSVVGPRPERPSFFSKLETAIPFYIERTYGLRPGITGLAQVNQAYDQSIEDVRNKVLYDHAYAARLSRWKEWLKADIGILFKTVSVMALGKGQ